MKTTVVVACALQALCTWAAPLTFTVAPDHTNHLYRVGEEASFTVTAMTNGVPVRDGRVAAALDNFGPKTQGERIFDLAKGNPFTVTGRLDEPGFLRLTLKAADTKPLVWSVGYEPERIEKGSPLPADFDVFWSAARAKLACEIPLDAKMTKVEERSTPDFDFYRISFATFGRRVYGYMSVPTDKARAPFPVEISVSAAGFGSWTNDMQGEADRIRVFFAVYPWAPHWDWLAMGLKTAYDNMNEAKKAKYGSGYATSGIAASREEYFFYPVLLGIDRAVDWIAARPDVDRSRFWYSGTSQGGGFGFYLAGLNDKFTKAALFVPAITDTMGYLKGRQSGWPRIIETFATRPEMKAEAERNAPYFDGANFATRIRCPVRVAVGFSDTTCAPCAVYAAFNAIPAADKGIRHGFGMTHSCFGSFYQELGNWLRTDAKGCVSGGKDVMIENARFRLIVGANAKVKTLELKSIGLECCANRAGMPLFSVTQDRPFNNEVKLIHPNKRTTYQANALRREGNKLIVGFEIAPYEAVIEVKETDSYVEFRLVDFLVDKEDYDYLQMEVPPVASFRVLQLPVLNRKNFGDWLNASWDEASAVGVVGTSPYADIDHENRSGYRILTADLVRGQKLKGASAAIIAASGREDFLDCMDRLERDFGLPLGVESRRSDAINAFIYHISAYPFDPKSVDRHIEWAKRGGFKFMTFNIGQICKETGSWGLEGDYDFSETFPRGKEDLRDMLAKVKAAGIKPGLHFYHPHIGMKSRYVTPVADPRLNKTRRFTLAKPLDDSTNVTELTVFEPTEGVTMFEPCRVLQFGGELVSYESYTKEPPYRFLGVKRGAWATTVTAHPYGQIGGILDISEYGQPMSCYLDQNTDLQEEVSAKIAAIYACGFEYAYFDGSEGVNVPCNFHVSNAQYRQWKLLEPKPIFAEGAAKTHFDWHILSGANAFDCFWPDLFVTNIVRFPVAQAPLSWQDMTRVNFGWWKYFAAGRKDSWGKETEGTKPDQWQFACSQCLAWDCPATILVNLKDVEADRANAEACFEVMRRWEEARERKLLTREQKEMLKDVRRRFCMDRTAAGELVLKEVGR